MLKLFPDPFSPEKNLRNKPDQATMRPDCISVRSDFGTRFGLTDR